MRYALLLLVCTACGAGSTTIADGGAPDAANDTIVIVDDIDSGIDATPDSMELSFDAGTDSAIDADDASVIDAGIDANQIDGGGCHNLANTAPMVSLMQSSAPAPTPQGGSITPGLYYMTATTWFNGSNGVYGTGQIMWDVKPSSYDEVVGTGQNASRTTWTWSAANTSMAVTETCYNIWNLKYGYTATNSELRVYMFQNLEIVFTRQ
jgi:hypothetical protein